MSDFTHKNVPSLTDLSGTTCQIFLIFCKKLDSNKRLQKFYMSYLGKFLSRLPRGLKGQILPKIAPFSKYFWNGTSDFFDFLQEVRTVIRGFKIDISVTYLGKLLYPATPGGQKVKLYPKLHLFQNISRTAPQIFLIFLQEVKTVIKGFKSFIIGYICPKTLVIQPPHGGQKVKLYPKLHLSQNISRTAPQIFLIFLQEVRQ